MVSAIRCLGACLESWIPRQVTRRASVRSSGGGGEEGPPKVWVTEESEQTPLPESRVEITIVKPPPPEEDDLKEIGLLYGGSLIASALIGPGIFTSPKGVVSEAGSVGMSLCIWAGCGVFSTIAALCFAELRESVRREGVEYAYISEAFGPVAAFVYCWMRIAAAEPVATAVFCLAFADYTADAIYDGCGPPQLLRLTLAILALVTLAFLNVFSHRLAEQITTLANIGKIVALSVIIVFGLVKIVRAEYGVLSTGFENTETDPTSIGLAIYNGLWAYGGWSNVNHVTRGVRKPPRNLPRLVKTIIPLVMVVYMLTVTSYFTVMTTDELKTSEAIGVTWAERTLGPAAPIIPISVGLIALGSANGTFMTAGRLSGVAVKDGNMPELASYIHVRSKAPLITVITRAAIATVMILVARLDQLVTFFVFSVWLFHGLSIVALLMLRVKDKDITRPYKVALPLPVLFVAAMAFLLVCPFLETPRIQFIVSLALIGFSLVFYLPSRYFSWQPSFSDKLIVYAQLFLRIAPRRVLRKRRMSMAAARRMSVYSMARRRSSVQATTRRGSSANILRSQSMAFARRPSNAAAVLRRGSTGASTLRRGSTGSILRMEHPSGILRRGSLHPSFPSLGWEAQLPTLEEAPSLSSALDEVPDDDQRENREHTVRFNITSDDEDSGSEADGGNDADGDVVRSDDVEGGDVGDDVRRDYDENGEVGDGDEGEDDGSSEGEDPLDFFEGFAGFWDSGDDDSDASSTSSSRSFGSDTTDDDILEESDDFDDEDLYDDEGENVGHGAIPPEDLAYLRRLAALSSTHL